MHNQICMHSMVADNNIFMYAKISIKSRLIRNVQSPCADVKLPYACSYHRFENTNKMACADSD